MGNNYGGKGFVKNNGRNTNQVKSPATETSKQVKTVVDFAEDAIKNLKGNQNLLTTSQLRKFLTAVTSVKNKIDLYKMHHREEKENFSEDLGLEVKLLKTTLYYQAGRDSDKKVSAFIDATNLGTRIDNIGTSYKQFHELYRYIEALVAFHKYYGGK